MMGTLSLPWGGDLELTDNGSLRFISGIEEMQQRIIRAYFTSPEQTLADGTFVAADYIFAPDYGIGAGQLIGQPNSQNLQDVMVTKIKNAILSDPNVDTTKDPIIQLYSYKDQIWANVTAYVLNGSPTTFAFQAR